MKAAVSCAAARLAATPDPEEEQELLWRPRGGSKSYATAVDVAFEPVNLAPPRPTKVAAEWFGARSQSQEVLLKQLATKMWLVMLWSSIEAADDEKIRSLKMATGGEVKATTLSEMEHTFGWCQSRRPEWITTRGTWCEMCVCGEGGYNSLKLYLISPLPCRAFKVLVSLWQRTWLPKMVSCVEIMTLKALIRSHTS